MCVCVCVGGGGIQRSGVEGGYRVSLFMLKLSYSIYPTRVGNQYIRLG